VVGLWIVELEEALDDLIGCRCFSAISGPSVEFAFVLHLGERQRRFLRLANQRLSFLQRTYEGSHTLLVECTWRIDGPNGVLSSCFDRAKPGGPRDAALEDLVDRAVEGIELFRPGLDLDVRFEGGLVLRLFATEADEKSKRNNWTYSCPFATATVGPRSRLQMESASERLASLAHLAALPPDEEVVEDWLAKNAPATEDEG
jgi:hypothetical protein